MVFTQIQGAGILKIILRIQPTYNKDPACKSGIFIYLLTTNKRLMPRIKFSKSGQLCLDEYNGKRNDDR